MRIRLRSFLPLLAFALAASAHAADAGKRVIILGVDGLDPQLMRRFIGEGRMPNAERLMKEGDFKPLQTSMPPLSPVAWSNFITGMDPGGHGVFDFIHRDPKTRAPFLSMSKAAGPKRSLDLGSWRIPVGSGEIQQLRRGETFWDALGKEGVPTTIFAMPVNFPPTAGIGKALSGMGTPDARGTPGTFSFYTTAPPPNAAEFTGGEALAVAVEENIVRARLRGPENAFRKMPASDDDPLLAAINATADGGAPSPDLAIEFAAYLDPEHPVAKFEVQDRQFILKEGEWSDWIPLRFSAVPGVAHVAALARFYLQSVRPAFKLYVSPLQIDPADPAMPVAAPKGWGKELRKELGGFYTQGLAEDTKAVSDGVLSGAEFFAQASMVYEERSRALDWLLKNFRKGMLFVYFSGVDQCSHMLYRYADEKHPGHVADPALADGLRDLYQRIDGAIGRAMNAAGENTTLIVMSDHGFAPFYWTVNLNDWLLERGYITLKSPLAQGVGDIYANVDWTRTQAYALGLNGIYVNLKGREDEGAVEPGAERDALVDRIAEEALALRDPRNGNAVVTLMTKPRKDFHGPHAGAGPDLIVGFNRGYRSSWESPLGRFSPETIADNKAPWSGDHAMDARLVPGVLLANRQITLDAPSLTDLTVAVMGEFGAKPLPEMIGRDCLGQ